MYMPNLRIVLLTLVLQEIPAVHFRQVAMVAVLIQMLIVAVMASIAALASTLVIFNLVNVILRLGLNILHNRLYLLPK